MARTFHVDGHLWRAVDVPPEWESGFYPSVIPECVGMETEHGIGSMQMRYVANMPGMPKTQWKRWHEAVEAGWFVDEGPLRPSLRERIEALITPGPAGPVEGPWAEELRTALDESAADIESGHAVKS